MIIAFVAVFGLIIGSFLNAVIYRLSVKKSAARGRSFCPRCKHVLRSADLIPIVSFAMLGGKCRYCHKKISWQYPAVELVTAILFAMIYQVMGLQFAFLSILSLTLALYAVAVLIIVFVYDLKHYLIMDSVVMPAIIIILIGNLLLGRSIFSLLTGALIAGGFFWFQWIASRGRVIGGGDISVGVLMGVLLGWQATIVALFIAYIVGGVLCVGLVLSGILGMKSKIPFATFLTFATFIAMLWGSQIWSWFGLPALFL